MSESDIVQLFGSNVHLQGWQLQLLEESCIVLNDPYKHVAVYSYESRSLREIATLIPAREIVEVSCLGSMVVFWNVLGEMKVYQI